MRLVIRLFELYYDPAMLKLYAMLQMNPLTDPPMPKDPVVIASAIEQIKNALNLIAAQLDGGQYCIGGKLSLADCALMPPFLQAKIVCPILGIDDFIAGQETISTYYDATRHDPDVARVLDDIEPYLRLLMSGKAA